MTQISIVLFLILSIFNVMISFSQSNDFYEKMSLIPLSGLTESFEGATFPPAGWTKVNVAFGSTGWERHLSGETPVPGFNYGYITIPPGGGNAIAFCNYITGGTTANDQWLITPQLTNIQPNDSLIFWLRKFGPYLDHMDIKISTTNPTPSSMTIPIALLSFQPVDSGWIRYKYRIGTLVPQSSNIYIGFRQWVTNATNQGASFSLDLVQVITTVGIRNINFNTPDSYQLYQNFPNPFNPSTIIKFDISKPGKVSLIVYDILGNEVSILINEINKSGSYEINFNGSNLSSGIYFYKLSCGSYIESKKMLLIK